MNEIIIDSGFNQSRVAILEEGELVEYYIESRDYKRIVGNIYKGRVNNVLPGMQAAFVDIGMEKNAFLYIKEAIPTEELKDNKNSNNKIKIKDVVKSGQEIIVQVVKEPIDNKGPRVTTHLTLPGRYFVLMPYTNYIGISRRIENEEERNRLREIVEQIKPKDMGLIIRTEAENKDTDDLEQDLKYLLKLWGIIERERKLGFAPKLIYEDLDLIFRTVRDMLTNNVEKLIINDKENYKKILDFANIVSPHLKDRIKYFDPGINLFSYFGIEKMIERALSRKVWLKSGGYIVIDKTEAFTIIDVNTGKYVGVNNLEDTIAKINKEAAREIAKQIRLRDIGGIIIIDFIDMQSKKAESEVIEELSTALAKDKIKTNILGMTQLGLLEMTRKKVRNRISSIIERDCPYCKGTGKVYTPEHVINNIEQELKRISFHTNSEAVLIETNPEIAKELSEGRREYLKEIQKKLNLVVHVRPNENIHVNNYVVKYKGRLDKLKELLG